MRIIQIIPATGWRAVYTISAVRLEVAGEQTAVEEVAKASSPLAGWALVETTSGTRVSGLTPGGSNGLRVIDEARDDFIGYEFDADTPRITLQQSIEQEG